MSLSGYNQISDTHALLQNELIQDLNLGITTANIFIQNTNLGITTSNNYTDTFLIPKDPKASITYLNPDISYNSFLGYKDDITTKLSELNNTNSLFDFSLTNQKINIVSTSISDSLGSTGIQTILLNGLDQNYLSITETINLSGTTSVQTTQNFHRLNSIIPTSIGTNKFAVGNITFSTSNNSNIYGIINSTENNFYSGRYTIPSGYYGSFDLVNFNSGLNDEHQIILRIKQPNLPLLDTTKYLINGSLSVKSNSYFVIPEKTDLQFYIKRLSIGTRCSSIASFYLIKM